MIEMKLGEPNFQEMKPFLYEAEKTLTRLAAPIAEPNKNKGCESWRRDIIYPELGLVRPKK